MTEKANDVPAVDFKQMAEQVEEVQFFELLAGLIKSISDTKRNRFSGHLRETGWRFDEILCALNGIWDEAWEVTKTRCLQRSEQAPLLRLLHGNPDSGSPLASQAVGRSCALLSALSGQPVDGSGSEARKNIKGRAVTDQETLKEHAGNSALAEKIKGQIITVEEIKGA